MSYNKHFDGFTEDWLSDYRRSHGQDVSAPGRELFTPPQPVPAKSKEPVTDAYSGKEKDFQAVAEEWLIFNHYYRRTKKNIANPSCKWWFLHFPKARGNPLVLDLILFNNGHFLEVELKVKGGWVEPHQQQLIDEGGAVAWNLRDLVAIVRAWEAEIENNKGVK